MGRNQPLFAGFLAFSPAEAAFQTGLKVGIALSAGERGSEAGKSKNLWCVGCFFKRVYLWSSVQRYLLWAGPDRPR